MDEWCLSLKPSQILGLKLFFGSDFSDCYHPVSSYKSPNPKNLGEKNNKDI